MVRLFLYSVVITYRLQKHTFRYIFQGVERLVNLDAETMPMTEKFVDVWHDHFFGYSSFIIIMSNALRNYRYLRK